MNNYDKLHQEIGDKFGLTARDVRFFRGWAYNKTSKREEIAEAIQNKLPILIQGKSYRVEFYLRRLAFLAKCTNDQWCEVIKQSELTASNKRLK